MKFFNKLKDILKRNNKQEELKCEKICVKENDVTASSEEVTESLSMNEEGKDFNSDKKSENIERKINIPDIDYEQYMRVLKETHDIEVIPTLFWTMFLKNNPIKKSFIKECMNLLANFTNTQYVYLAKEFRKRSSMDWNFEWRNITMDYLLEDYMTEEERILTAGLASLHPSGFMRERALEELGKYDGEKIMPFVILRNCDWVAHIRKKAQNILINLIKEENIKCIINNIFLIHKIRENIDGLRGYYKYDEWRNRILDKDENFIQALYKRVDEILADDENKIMVKEILLKSSFNKDRFVQEYSLSKIINLNLLAHDEIIKIIIKVKNPTVSFKCLKLLFDKLSGEEIIGFKGELEKVNGAKAKNEFLRKLYESGFFKSAEDVQSYALSKYASVRELARFYMRKFGFKDFNNFYKENLKSDKSKKTALIGLCETCTAEEAQNLCVNFEYGSSKIQKKILKRIIELSDVEPCCDYNIFIKAIESKCDSVIKLSRRYIVENYELFDLDTLYDRYLTTNDELLKETYAGILCSGSKWTGLKYCLLLLEEKNNRGRDIALINIQRWVREKKNYLSIDKESGKIRYHNLYKMNENVALPIKKLFAKNEKQLPKDIRRILQGLILNYGQ